MILDIDVPPAVLPRATYQVPGVIADKYCAATLGAFTGAELVADLLTVPAVPVRQLVGRWVPLPPGEAVQRRGCAVVNRAGRLGVTLGRGLVVEPIGREYALTADPPTRWAAGYLITGVTYTIKSGPAATVTHDVLLPVNDSLDLIPDPQHPGLYFIGPKSSLTPDPQYPGLLRIGGQR